MLKVIGADVQKAYYYLQRNGAKNTYYAVKERLAEKKNPAYVFMPPTKQELEAQQKTVQEWASASEMMPYFSILVPAYRTDFGFFWDLISCVINQSYPAVELIIADASPNAEAQEKECGHPVDTLLTVLQTKLVQERDWSSEEKNGEFCFQPKTGDESLYGLKIRYKQLTENAGISANTNQALAMAEGDYIGLLDHDDLLTENALFEMVQAMHQYALAHGGEQPEMLYSDEDKCDGSAEIFFDPNEKPDLDPFYLLTNNYICHFLVLKRTLMQKLQFRPEYDGAQDFDLILRSVHAIQQIAGYDAIVHLPKVLYHWRCHLASTAQNPKSKEYAYVAGQRAAEAILQEKKWPATVYPLRHLGFFGIKFSQDPLSFLPEVGALGGVVAKDHADGKIIGGIAEVDGSVRYAGMLAPFSGKLHRAVLLQLVPGLDIRCLHLEKSLWPLFEQVAGVPYTERPLPKKRDISLQKADRTIEGWETIFDYYTLPEDTDWADLNLRLAQAISAQGKQMLYLPQWETIWKK